MSRRRIIMEDRLFGYIDKCEKEFRFLVEKSFGVKLEGMSTYASYRDNSFEFIEQCSINFDARTPLKNKLLKDSSYYYSENKKLIHFTSISALFSIINEGAIRMYNLHNSNDDSEYSYAASLMAEIYELQGVEELAINEYIYKTVKENSFILSLTSLDELRNKKFWEKYGHKGKGVAIEFEIVNDLDEWEHFYCSKVQYDNLREFELLRKNWKKLQIENSHIQYRIDFNHLLSLHKSADWSEEKEIRLLTLYPAVFHTELFNERIYSDFKLDKADKPIKYFKLPLCDKNGEFIEKELNSRSENFWEKIPKLRISNIYFSSDCPISNDFTNFQVYLQKYVSDKMNCWIGSLPDNKKVEYVKQTSCFQLSRIFNLFLIIIQYLKQFFNLTTTHSWRAIISRASIIYSLAFIYAFNKL